MLYPSLLSFIISWCSTFLPHFHSWPPSTTVTWFNLFIEHGASEVAISIYTCEHTSFLLLSLGFFKLFPHKFSSVLFFFSSCIQFAILYSLGHLHLSNLSHPLTSHILSAANLAFGVLVLFTPSHTHQSCTPMLDAYSINIPPC